MAISHTARGTPGGTVLDDGFSTLVTFATDTEVELWEKTVKPPGVDGGEPISTSTMHNTKYHTSALRTLMKLTDGSFTCAYDPAVYTAIVALINVDDTITITFPDATHVSFYGGLTKFEPSEHQEGEQPEASCTFVINSYDATAGETAPLVGTP